MPYVVGRRHAGLPVTQVAARADHDHAHEDAPTITTSPAQPPDGAVRDAHVGDAMRQHDREELSTRMPPT